MGMTLALGIVEQNGKNYVILEATQDNMQVKLSISDDENYEEDLNVLIQGITEVRAQMRRAKSGLIAVEGVIPDGLRSIQGGGANSPRSPRKQGPRTPKR